MANPTILKWLRDGKFYEALMGKNGYFIGDHTYIGNHDLLLVISTMFELAKDEHEMVSRKFNEVVKIICKEDTLISLHIISTYLLLKKSRKFQLDADVKQYAHLIQNAEPCKKKYSSAEKYKISCLLAAIKKEVPEFDIIDDSFFKKGNCPVQVSNGRKP